VGRGPKLRSRQTRSFKFSQTLINPGLGGFLGFANHRTIEHHIVVGIDVAGKELKIVAGYPVVRVCSHSSLMGETVHHQGPAASRHVVQRAYDVGPLREFYQRWIGLGVAQIGIDGLGNDLHLKGNTFRFQQVRDGPECNRISKWTYVFETDDGAMSLGCIGGVVHS
jgi:hypothetical protein